MEDERMGKKKIDGERGKSHKEWRRTSEDPSPGAGEE